MENIVYILGAGFSAPLGLPVINDFLIKGQDLYFKDPAKYKDFLPVLKTIGEMHKAKSHYNLDLLNIEEILSILEMEDHIEENPHRSRSYINFIKTVIEESTPKLEELPKIYPGLYNILPQHLDFKGFFGNSILHRYYGLFVANLLNLSLHTQQITVQGTNGIELIPSQTNPIENKYSVITLNYDMVLENIISHLGNLCINHLHRPIQSFPLAKLHGSVNTELVTPTWKKWINIGLKNQWELAFSLLKSANQIRFIGYSLPLTDSYIRYLLSAGLIKTESHLKNIDFICFDDSFGNVEKRFNDFVPFKRRRFKNIKFESYLEMNGGSEGQNLYEKNYSNGIGTLTFNKLERLHKRVFES